MEKLPIYCSIGFLAELYKHIDRPIIEWIEDEESDVIKKLYNLIHKHGEIFIDEQLPNFSNPNLPSYNPHFKKIIKNGKIPDLATIHFTKIANEENDFFKSELHPRAIIFTDYAKEKAATIERKFGVMVFTKEDISRTSFLFQHGLEVFVKDNKKEWAFLSKYKHPFNAMVISDTYLLKDKKGINNLNLLLKNLLPEYLEIPFDLTIIAEPSDIEKPYKEIAEFLSKNFTYEINLSIIKQKIHDRNFITNYLCCSSGYGFELIENGKSCRNTHLTVLPIAYLGNKFSSYKSDAKENNAEDSLLPLYISLMKDFKKENDKPTNNSVLKFSLGSKQNRLFREN